MGIIGKLLKYLLILLVLSSPWWFKAIPSQYFTALIGKSQLVDKLLCNFSTKVSGESMSPVVAPGTSIGLTRCFTEKDLTQNTLVLYRDGSSLRFGIIRHVLSLNPVVYKISDEKAPELFHDLVKEEIVAVTHHIDLSKTRYQTGQDTGSFVLAPDDFISDFYLAKIPKGTGLETAAVEKTNVFNRRQDKFCFAVVPKQNLTAVDVEIINGKTHGTVPLGNNLVLNASQKPNINCMDFGSGPGELNLDQGGYRYRLLINHQALEDVSFTVD
ncbi:hypothetical protein M1523_03405 [Patescibacteria group bacterium]|nr:hypothetical protein [Patescibacteria group bacterium]MCL5091231.1 hypothetical protein [Patescibacteria group bacterium]